MATISVVETEGYDAKLGKYKIYLNLHYYNDMVLSFFVVPQNAPTTTTTLEPTTTANGNNT